MVECITSVLHVKAISYSIIIAELSNQNCIATESVSFKFIFLLKKHAKINIKW